MRRGSCVASRCSWGVADPAEEKLPLLSQLYQRLVQIYEAGKKAVVLIDEAQMLATRELMEEFRGLLNLEVPERKLLSFVFFGLPDIDEAMKLDPPLKQRVALKFRLEGLNRDGTEHYIAHRLGLAGAQHPIFTAAALDLIHNAASGIPRLINTICDNLLLEGALSQARVIDAPLVVLVAENLGFSTDEPEPEPEPAAKPVARVALTKQVRPAATAPAATSAPIASATPAARPPVTARPATPTARPVTPRPAGAPSAAASVPVPVAKAPAAPTKPAPADAGGDALDFGSDPAQGADRRSPFGRGQSACEKIRQPRRHRFAARLDSQTIGPRVLTAAFWRVVVSQSLRYARTNGALATQNRWSHHRGHGLRIGFGPPVRWQKRRHHHVRQQSQLQIPTATLRDDERRRDLLRYVSRVHEDLQQ